VLGGPRALIVEDDPAVRALVAIRLRGAGFRVDEAGDGDDGFRRALEGAPDVVVVDAMLPGRDGFELAQGLRDSGRECAIVILSARGQASDLRRGYQAGVDDYIIKPFDAADMVQRILEAVDRRSGSG
jgi:DNA-binding response OmpR family regulator